MKLQVEKALAQAGEVFDFTGRIALSEWEQEPPFDAYTAPTEVAGTYYYDGQRLHVEGIITTRGHYICTRCLDEVDLTMEVPFHEVYMRAEVADDDALVYDGKTVDVLPLVRDTLIIEAPYQVLCQENCRGLCGRCGCNLNHESCQCNDAETDPRWAALAALKEKK